MEKIKINKWLSTVVTTLSLLLLTLAAFSCSSDDDDVISDAIDNIQSDEAEDPEDDNSDTDDGIVKFSTGVSDINSKASAYDSNRGYEWSIGEWIEIYSDDFSLSDITCTASDSWLYVSKIR